MRPPYLALTLFLVLTPFSALSAKPVRVNGMAAKANGDVITMNEVMIELAPIQSVLMAQFPRRGATFEAQLKKQRDRILDSLIDRTIIYTEFEDRISSIPDEAVEEEIQRHIQRRHAGDQKLFRKYLKATNLTNAQFKEQQRKKLLVDIVRSQQFPDLPLPTQAELDAEYAEWRVRNRDRTKDIGTYHKIYLRKGFDKESALQLAEKLVVDLKAGADFAALAKEHSTDSRAAEGGLWKDVPRTDLNPEFGFIVFDLEEQGVMGPIEDQHGITIVKVAERKLGPAKPLASIKDELKRLIDGKKRQESVEKWMKKLRDKSPIQKMVE